MYDLGIIGGMGPLASADIYRRIIEKTEAANDQEHISIVILNKTSIPDRSNAILNGGASPVASLNESISELKKLNTKNFIIACNTAHYFVDELEYKDINLINMVDEVLIKLNELYQDYPIIILSTIGTIRANIYKTNKHSKALNIMYPDNNKQKIIMDFIYEIKTGCDKLVNIKCIEEILEEYKNINPKCVYVFACTELSLVSKYLKDKYNVLDAVDILVEATINKCGYKIKEQL